MKRNSVCQLLLIFSPVFGLAWGQSALHCYDGGAWHPVVEMKRSGPLFFDGESVRKGDVEDLTMLAADRFGDGFVEVEIVSTSRGGVRKDDGLLRFTQDTAWYSLKARVRSEADMTGTYLVLRFDTFGKTTYHCRPIADLEAGKTRMIEIYIGVEYEMPKQLHIFSGSQELRTSLVKHGYVYSGSEFVARRTKPEFAHSFASN